MPVTSTEIARPVHRDKRILYAPWTRSALSSTQRINNFYKVFNMSKSYRSLFLPLFIAANIVLPACTASSDHDHQAHDHVAKVEAKVPTASVAVGASPISTGVSAAAPTATPPLSPPAATGEIRKIDKEAGKITLRHGEIKNLEMPAMTMVFVARRIDLLDGLKVGDKVKFSAVNENGKFVVTQILSDN